MRKIQDSRLTKELLNECFRYEDGRIFWKVRPRYHFISDREHNRFNAQYSGKEAFCYINPTHGYSQGGFMKRNHLRSFIVYTMHKGTPTRSLRHIDKCKTNDRLDNLVQVGDTLNNNTATEKGIQ